MLPHNELAGRLASELETLPLENAERLSLILRGLFECLQDLDTRLAAIEEKRVIERLR